MILLNPGPVTLSARVRRALNGQDLCHREPEFEALMVAVLRRLENVYQDSAGYAAVMLSGSGTCAVEAMLSTFALRERTTLILCNGVYGERMATMLKQQCKPVLSVACAWTAPIDLESVKRTLDQHPDIARVTVVHHETTTGRLNDIAPLAALCRSRGIGLLVDAVSSFGGEALSFADLRPLAVAGTANKCLHGVPGIAFVLARRDALAAESAATSLYLDLAAYYREQVRGGSPFTLPVQVVQALHEALSEFDDAGGWQSRRQLYRSRSDAVRDLLLDMGVGLIVPRDSCASMLSAFALPPGVTYGRLHAELKSAGFTIYAGQGHLAGNIFRIATMGEIGAVDMERLLIELRRVLGGKAAA